MITGNSCILRGSGSTEPYSLPVADTAQAKIRADFGDALDVPDSDTQEILEILKIAADDVDHEIFFPRQKDAFENLRAAHQRFLDV